MAHTCPPFAGKRMVLSEAYGRLYSVSRRVWSEGPALVGSKHEWWPCRWLDLSRRCQSPLFKRSRKAREGCMVLYFEITKGGFLYKLTSINVAFLVDSVGR